MEEITETTTTTTYETAGEMKIHPGWVIGGVVVSILIILAVVAVWWLSSPSSTDSGEEAMEGGVTLCDSKRVSDLEEGQYGIFYSQGCGWCGRLKQDLMGQQPSSNVEVLMFDVSLRENQEQMAMLGENGVPIVVRMVDGKLNVQYKGYSQNVAKEICST